MATGTGSSSTPAIRFRPPMRARIATVACGPVVPSVTPKLPLPRCSRRLASSSRRCRETLWHGSRRAARPTSEPPILRTTTTRELSRSKTSVRLES
uniref:Uncharacterized protein n=1 Tax=uncultured marine virus TaxID=186617 RepID=A0A0F7LAJ1_9VIRU|nr:hypothetical protein [uncultured marine virus]